jgi:hypothetical protein
MSPLEGIRSAMVGKFYSRFAVDVGFDFYFPDFVLSSREVTSADEQIIDLSFVDSYQPAQHTASPDWIAKSTVIAACLDIPVTSVDLRPDSSLLLTFNNGVAVCLPTDTPTVDWHWAITESGSDPYISCLVACFAPGDIQGCMPNNSFKPNPLRGSA